MTACKHGGKLDADGFLLLHGEGVDNTVNRLGRAGGVQGAEDQVAGFRRRDGGFHGFQIAQFAHQNHVRVLAQGAAQGLGKAGNINVNLALGDDGLLVFVVILDGVFDGDDVGVVAGFVDDVDHRSQAWWFCRSRWGR